MPPKLSLKYHEQSACTNQRTQEIPVAGAVPMVKLCPEANQGAVLFHQGAFLQIFGKIYQHPALGFRVAAKAVQSLQIAKQIAGHLQLPGGEEAGVGGDAFALPCVDFIPDLGKEDSVLRSPGDFFDV